MASSGAIPTAKLRRIAINQQGLLKKASFGLGESAVLRTIKQIGYVQIDTISVVSRAHHHVLHSRVPNYQPKHLQSLQDKGQIFEYWSHAAAYLPMDHYRYALPRMASFRDTKYRWRRSNDTKLMKAVLKRVTTDGPLMSRDFESEKGKSNGWWDWKPAKRALEQLFMQGDLMITGREGFQKRYDLPERVLPSGIDTSAPTELAFAEHLVDATFRSHGFANLKSFTHGRRGQQLRKNVKQILNERVADKILLVIQDESGESFYIEPGLLEQRSPKPTQLCRLLSPFDNLVIQRERAQKIFDFDYTIECYVPEPKRQYGYYCLPIIYNDALIGRLDAKVHRDIGLFELKALHLEQHKKKQKSAQLDNSNMQSIGQAVRSYALFNHCTAVKSTTVEWLSVKQRKYFESIFD